MDGNETLWLVVNGASGSHAEEAIARLCDILGDAGARPARIIDLQADELPGMAELDGDGVTILAVHGGDGTLNAAAGTLEGWGGAMLVLPGGTANLLCKRIHGECDAEAVAREFAAGRLARIRTHCIRGSQGLALVEVVAGPGAAWADVREEMREGNIVETVATAMDAASKSTVGPMVVIKEPALGREQGYAGVRLSIRDEHMAVQGYGAEDIGDYLMQGVAILKRDFREGPHDELGAHESILCRSLEGAPIELMIDGERKEGAAEERFSLAPLDLDLLGPRYG